MSFEVFIFKHSKDQVNARETLRFCVSAVKISRKSVYLLVRFIHKIQYALMITFP